MTTTATTTIRVGRWQRNAAGVLFAAALVTIVYSAWVLFVSVMSFGAAGGAITVRLPVSESTALGGGIAAYYTEAIVWVDTVSFWPQAWLATAHILWAIVWITLALCVLVFSYGAYHGEVFSPRLPRLLAIAAIAVGAGGSVANWLQMWGTSTAMSELLSGPSSLQLDSWTSSADVLWTILAGLLLALLAIVFRSGTQFKRDTEGLV